MVTVNNYYNNIPVGRDLNNLPNTSSTGTTVGYQYDSITEEVLVTDEADPGTEKARKELEERLDVLA